MCPRCLEDYRAPVIMGTIIAAGGCIHEALDLRHDYHLPETQIYRLLHEPPVTQVTTTSVTSTTVTSGTGFFTR